MSTERLFAYVLRWGALAALAGGIASIWGLIADPETFFSAWLAAFYFWLSMPLGALALLLVWDLTGRWEPMAQLPLNAMSATMPLFVLFFLPLLAGIPGLYPWARPEVAATLHNTWYLNPTFFYARAIVYFAIWNALAIWRTPMTGTTVRTSGRRSQWLSAVGLMLLVYTVAYSSLDWVLSTEPRWFSSMFGMIACSTRLIASLCAALLMMLAQASFEERQQAGFRKALASLAAVLLAVVIFWMYAAFCQWLIIWEENLPSEISWYIERWRQPWGAVIYALVAAHFAIPFLTLVWGPTKRKPVVVGWTCALLLLADMVHVWWVLLPGLKAVQFSWIHPAAMIGAGGVWLLTLAATLRMSGGREGTQGSPQEGLIHG